MKDNVRVRVTGRAFRAYWYFLCGAIGGLTGWYLEALASQTGQASEGAPPLGYLALHGAILGSLIGLGCGVFDGIASRAMVRVVKFGGTSLILGLIAGAVALPLVQILYSNLSPAAGGIAVFLYGTFCWILFGGMIGLGEGLSKGSQTWKGLVGGMVGGVIGGGIYEAIGRPASSNNSMAGLALLALAFSTLGGFIGSAIALVTTVLTDAWLVIENGKLAGTEVNISKYVHKDLGSRRAGIIGSSQWEANIYLPGDSDVLSRHASISYIDGAPTLTALPAATQRKAKTAVNGRPISAWPLSNGDRLQIGSTTLMYRQKR